MKKLLINLLNISVFFTMYTILSAILIIVDLTIFNSFSLTTPFEIIHILVLIIPLWYSADFSSEVAYEFLECLGYEEYTLNYKIRKNKELVAKVKRDMELAHYYNY